MVDSCDRRNAPVDFIKDGTFRGLPIKEEFYVCGCLIRMTTLCSRNVLGSHLTNLILVQKN